MSIVGTFAYRIEGFMQTISMINGRRFEGDGGDLSSNAAGAVLAPVTQGFRQPAGPPITTYHAAAPLPSLRTYRSPLTPPFDPAPVKSVVAPFDVQAASAGDGLYPFSEVGYLDIDSSWNVQAWIFVNYSGYPFPPPDLNLPTATGAFVVDTPFSGTISLQVRQVNENHVWDYSVVLVGADELFISVAFRMPRPAVGSGTMQRIATSGFEKKKRP